MRETFRLSTGGLPELLQRLIRGPAASGFPVPVQIAVAVVVLWLPLVLLSWFDGALIGENVIQPFFKDIVPQVRLLIAIPMLLLADVAIDPVTRSAIVYLQDSGIVASSDRPRVKEALERMHEATDSIWPDVVIVLLAFTVAWVFKPGYGATASLAVPTSWLWTVQDGSVSLSPAGWWYMLVSAPLFQVILFRWFWRFLIWAAFLYQVSRLSLVVQPTHPDQAGGLGYLGTAQQTFVTVFLAFTTVASSTIAHDILAEGGKLVDSRLEIAVLVVGFTVVIYAPLAFFANSLFMARRDALAKYGVLAYQQSEAFDQAWIKKHDDDAGKSLLSAVDPSSMADYSATYDNVRSMRFIPASGRSILTVAGILAVPFLPLALTEFSIQDLFKRLADALV